MHVAYVCADEGVPVFGTKGSSVHVQEIVRAWRKKEATVTLYCTRLGTDRPEDLADLDVVEVAAGCAEGPARELALEDAAFALAARILQDGCDLVYERYSLFSPVVSVVASVLGVPAVLEVNAPLIEEQARYRQLFDMERAEMALGRNARAADVVACVSAPVVRWVHGRVPTARTVLTPNGVNVERIAARTGGRHHDDHLTVGFVGTLKPWHGVPELFQAVALANMREARSPSGPNRWAVKVIGDGPVRTTLEDLATSLGLESDFTGAVAPGSVAGLLHECDVAAAPYPVEEPGRDDYFSPLKVYEYMAAGMPIVATSVGQIPSILDHGRTGLLVPAGDPAAFAAALGVLAVDPGLRDRLGIQAREQAEMRFGWDGVLSRITAALPAPRKVA